VSAAAYLCDYTDLQAQFWDGTASILANASGAKIRGLEAEGLFQLTPAFSISGGFGWLARAKYDEFSGVAYQLPNGPGGMVFNVENADGDRMLKAPKFTGNVTLTYATELAGGALDASATLFHSSATSFDLLRRVTQKSYETINAAVSYSPAALNGLRVTVFGKNLANKEYFTGTLLGPTADAPVYSPPRSFGIAAEFSF
jgi:iron complex outermembrane receptor protein